MEKDIKDLVNAVNTSARDLKLGIDMHCCLVASVMGEQADERVLKLFQDAVPRRCREQKLERAIQRAIDELEESRKSFKSKRLEMLRKNLTMVLAGMD